MGDWTEAQRRAAVEAATVVDAMDDEAVEQTYRAAVIAVQAFAGALADQGVPPAQVAIQLHSIANVVVFTALGLDA